MKLIGGEAELNDNGAFLYLTDSGRSSLRLILDSGMRNRKFLLPDYLCKIILDVFDERSIEYDFYRVNRDLSVNFSDIKNKKFDVLYLISYFGQRHNIAGWLSKNRNALIIEDGAFTPVLERPMNIKNWIGFNSFRKMSYLPEGSIIKSSIKLRDELVAKKDAKFIELKYKAKRIKYEYLTRNKYSQNKYLDLFVRAEEFLNKQTGIYSISNRGFFNLFEFYRNFEKEYTVRQRNFEVLNRHLKDVSIRIKPEYYSFYVLDVNRRDELKAYLFSKKIFLPVHWPAIEGRDNILYQRVLSIPVDSRYDQDDMAKIARFVRGFLNKKMPKARK